MKLFITTIALLALGTTYAQEDLFIRIYDESGRKFAKGKLVETTDSSLILERRGKNIEIRLDSIMTLRLHRSFGHDVLISTVIGATGMAIFGMAVSDPNDWFFPMTAAEGAIAGLIGGATIGAPAGAAISGLRKRPVFYIDGDSEKWKQVRHAIARYIQKRQNKNSQP